MNELDQISTVADFMAFATSHPCRFAAGARSDTVSVNEVTLGLPRLTAGRDFAQELVGVLGDITGKTVRVDCSSVVSMTANFAAQLVESVLIVGRAQSMLVFNLGSRVGVEAMRTAAQALDVTGALSLVDKR